MTTTSATVSTVTPGIGRRVVASLWAALAMPYFVLAIWVPLARAAGLFAKLPIPAVVVGSILAGPALVMALPRLAAVLPASLDDWLAPGNPFLLRHSCLTAYLHGAILSTDPRMGMGTDTHAQSAVHCGACRACGTGRSEQGQPPAQARGVARSGDARSLQSP
ncbi:MAG: hypothetical protein IPK82_37625 [Polyangiaceae bacterium]|nr:hypothetical protein [Polyangiaceae bacterium]